MKLRQKLAMILAAATVSTTIPVQTHALAGGAEVIKTSMTTKPGYNTYGYYQEEIGDLYPEQNRAINIGLKNHTDRFPKYVSQLPGLIHIKATNMAFDERLFQETKKDLTNLDAGDPNPDTNSYQLMYNVIFRQNIIPLNDYEYHYALPDNSQYNDRAYATKLISTKDPTGGSEGPDDDLNIFRYPHRIYTIDNEGNYTSFVSIEYAGTNFKKYLEAPGTNVDDDYMDVYLFGLATKDLNKDGDTTDDNEMIYLNLLETGISHDGYNREILKINNDIPKPIGTYSEVLGNLDKYNKFYSSTESVGARLYVKEYTLYRDQYGDDTSLEMVTFQRMGKENNYAERMFLPLAFRVTGAKPYIKISDEFGLFTVNWNIELASNSTVSDSFVDISLDSIGYMSTDGKGHLGSFDLEENINFIFNGNFTDDRTEGGRSYHIKLSNKDVKFDYSKLNDAKYWDKMPVYNELGELQYDGQLGDLADYIRFTSGLRGYENYIQVEVLGVENNELVIRITDESLYAPDIRKYEGGLNFTKLPFEIDKRTELDEGNLDITIEEVEDIKFVEDEEDGKVDKVNFRAINSTEETFNIAKISADNFKIELESKADLVAGREKSDTVQIKLQELVENTVDLRDVIYFTFDNAYVANESLEDIEFEFENSRPVKNNNHIFKADDDFGNEFDVSEREGMEYILDLDELYEACIEMDLIKDDDPENNIVWNQMLESMTFDLELAASYRSEIGDINLEIESDNLLEGDMTLLAGSVKSPFSIEMEPISLDLGIKDQIAGEIIIKETASEMLADNSEIIIAIEGQHIIDADIKCDSASDIDAKIEATDEGLLVVTIKSESDEIPGEIIIDNLEFDIWAGTPQGKYDLFLSGNALDDNNIKYNEIKGEIDEDEDVEADEVLEYVIYDTINVRERDYLTVGTDLVAPQTIKTIVDFRNKSATVNGVHVHLTSEPYIVPSTWTSMIGVRDIATCFGVPSTHIAAYHDENDVMTVTIANGKMGEEGATIITVRDKSKILIVNGTPVIMAEPLTIGEDDRAYAPIRPIAEALGLEVTWDALSQRATFVN